MEITISGESLKLDDQGYLEDLNNWSKEFAEAIAQEEEINLTEEHFKVLEFLQQQYKNEIPLTIRKVGKSGVIDIKGFYALFPGGPLKKASRIAGIKKPVSCI